MLTYSTVVTTDLFLAAFLLVEGSELAVRQPQGGNRFYEIGAQGATELKELYQEGLAFVVLVDFKRVFYRLLKESGLAIRP
jgi:hypothetical protein